LRGRENRFVGLGALPGLQLKVVASPLRLDLYPSKSNPVLVLMQAFCLLNGKTKQRFLHFVVF